MWDENMTVTSEYVRILKAYKSKTGLEMQASTSNSQTVGHIAILVLG